MGFVLVALGCMFQGSWRSGKELSIGRQWALAAILYGFGDVFIAFRGQLPPLVSVVVANTLIFVSVALVHRGTMVFTRTKPSDQAYWLTGAAVFTSFCYFTFASPNIEARIVIISLCRLPFFTHAAWLLWRTRPVGSVRLLSFILVVSTAWFTFRAGVTEFNNQNLSDFLKAGSFQAMNFLITAVVTVLMVAAQLRIENEQVRAGLDREANELRLARDNLEHTIAERNAELLQANAELSRANSELENFAYVTSHDLRQPVRTVINYLSLIEKKLGPTLDADLTKYFGFASNGARRMDSLIVDLLEYSQTGHKTAVFEPISLGAAVNESLENLSSIIADAHASILVAGALPTILGCRSDLTRLMQNLIGNAVKYRHPDRLPEIAIGCRDDNGRWLVWVADNGVGIPPEFRERVFGMFQRLVPKKDIEGTGIGLTVCRKVVEAHGGQIWVEDAPHGGCTFMMTFPKIDQDSLNTVA